MSLSVLTVLLAFEARYAAGSAGGSNSTSVDHILCNLAKAIIG
jgi:hypothetical protein